MTYGEWLRAQTPERQEASLQSMDLARRHGEEQRRAPFSDECKRMAAEIAAYYAKWDGKDAPI